MKLSFALAGLLPLTLSAHATVVGLGIIEQPLNLGRHADPTRIPLAAVGVESNHGYDVHHVISAPRPLTHGAFSTGSGIELNANLASLFGVSVEPMDPTNVPNDPVVIRIAGWPKPAWSPYSRKQVVAATLHCLLRSVRATEKAPLKLRIEAADPGDAKALAVFARDYITSPLEEPNAPFQITTVPGSHIETGPDGLPWVHFDDAPHRDGAPTPAPGLAFIPFSLEGGDYDNNGEFTLLPEIAGDTWQGDPRELVLLRAPLVHDCFNPVQGLAPEANVLIHLEALSSASLSFDDQGRPKASISIVPGRDPGRLPGAFAATCHALVLSLRPSTAKPLTIRLSEHPGDGPLAGALDGAAGWKVLTRPTDQNRSITLEAEFTWDGENQCPAGASIPGWRLEASGTGHWSVSPGTPQPNPGEHGQGALPPTAKPEAASPEQE